MNLLDNCSDCHFVRIEQEQFGFNGRRFAIENTIAAMTALLHGSQHSFSSFEEGAFGLKCDVEKDLRADCACVICFSTMHIPKTLPCGHTFCGACIDKLVRSDHLVGVECSSVRKDTCADRMPQLSTVASRAGEWLPQKHYCREVDREKEKGARGCRQCEGAERREHDNTTATSSVR